MARSERRGFARWAGALGLSLLIALGIVALTFYVEGYQNVGEGTASAEPGFGFDRGKTARQSYLPAVETARSWQPDSQLQGKLTGKDVPPVEFAFSRIKKQLNSSSSR